MWTGMLCCPEGLCWEGWRAPGGWIVVNRRIRSEWRIGQEIVVRKTEQETTEEPPDGTHMLNHLCGSENKQVRTFLFWLLFVHACSLILADQKISSVFEVEMGNWEEQKQESTTSSSWRQAGWVLTLEKKKKKKDWSVDNLNCTYLITGVRQGLKLLFNYLLPKYKRNCFLHWINFKWQWEAKK